MNSSTLNIWYFARSVQFLAEKVSVRADTEANKRKNVNV